MLKNIKKTSLLVASLSSLVLLVACGQQQATSSSAPSVASSSSSASSKQASVSSSQQTDSSSTTEQATQSTLTMDEAKAAAFADAGVTEEEVRNLSLDMDQENGMTQIEVDFIANQQEYDYTFDAATKEIIAKSVEPADADDMYEQ